MTRTALAPDLSPVFIAPEPFSPRVSRRTALPGQTVAQVLTAAVRAEELALDDLERVAVYVDGVSLEEALGDRDAMLDFILPPGVTLNVAVEPLGGGGGGGGNKALKTVLTIAVIALSFYVGGGAATPGLLDNLLIRTALAATVNVVGQMAISAAFSGKGDQLAEANDRRALEGASNQFRPRESFPLALGGQTVGADLASAPYTQNVGDDTWLHIGLAWHYGPCILEDIKVGKTLLADYPAEDVQVEHFLSPGPRTSFLYPGRVVQENYSDELDQSGGGTWEVNTAAVNAERIEVDITFPNGIKYNADSGKIRNEEVSGRIEYAEVGTEGWLSANIPISYYKNGSALPLGTWYVNARTNDAIRKTYGFTLPDKSKRWKVRVKSYDDQGEFPSDDRTTAAYWSAMRSIERKAPIVDETLSVTFLRIRSSDDLNGSLPTISARVTPIVPVWNGADWSTVAPSSNAAALVRWLLTGPAAAIPLRPDQIDASAATAFDLIVARQWEGAVGVTADASQQDVMIRLGRLGRFATYWNGRKLCFVTDWEKPAPRQVFAGRNAQGYRYRRAFPDPVHAVIVEFTNIESEGQADELTVYNDGFDASNAELIETLRLDFSCSLERAYREGRVYLAKLELQTEVHEWTAGADSIATTYGDRVLVRHLSTLYGLADCRVDYRHWSGGLVAGVRLDQPVTMVSGEEYAIDIRRADAVIRGVPLVNVPGTSRTITFAAPRVEANAPEKGDLIVFGTVGLVTEDVEIVDVEPAGDMTATFRAVRYLAPEIMAAETGPIPDLVSGITPRPRAPLPRITGAQGDPSGVVVTFAVDPVRGAFLDGFSARWRRAAGPGQPENPWSTLPPIASTSREARTPPIPDALTVEGDVVAEYRVDVEIRSVLRNGDVSDPVVAADILVRKGVAPPTGVSAVGVTRTGADGSSYPALYITADLIDAGDTFDLVVEVKLSGADDSTYVSAGQPLPARNPRGDMLNVAGGRSYVPRAKWRTSDGWSSPWVVAVAPVYVPPGQVSTDTVNVGGTPAVQIRDLASLIPGIAELSAELDAAVFDPTSGLRTKTDGLLSSLNTPTTGVLARITYLESVSEGDGTAIATRVSALEATVNTAGTGLTARLAVQESASASLAAGKADATRVSVLEAKARYLPNMVKNSDFSQGGRYWSAGSAWQYNTGGGHIGCYAVTYEAGTQFLVSDYYRCSGSFPYSYSMEGDGGSNPSAAGAYVQQYADSGSDTPGGLISDGNDGTNLAAAAGWGQPIQSAGFTSHPDARWLKFVLVKNSGTSYAAFSKIMFHRDYGLVSWNDEQSETDKSARLSSAESAIVTNNSASVTRLSALEATVNTPGTGVVARLGTAESAIATNNSATVTRLSGLEATVNTPGTGLSARLFVAESAVASAAYDLAEAKFVITAEATGGRPAIFGLISNNRGTSAIALNAAQVYLGDNTVFDDASDTLQTVTAGVRYVLATGASFGVGGLLREWEGPDSVALSSMSTANAVRYRLASGYVGGPGYPAAGLQVTANRLTAGRNVSSSGNFTTIENIALTVTGGSGSYTYEWITLAAFSDQNGSSNMRATGTTGSTTQFNGTVAAGETIYASAVCLITDTVSAKTIQFTGRGRITNTA